jgi:glutamine synthetase adenylyltransferase
MKRLLMAPPSGSTEGWQGIDPISGIPSAAVGEATPDRVPTAEIRHALRALASETGPLTGLRGVKLVRPLVTRAHEVLRERLEAGGSVEAYLRDRTRLADSVVIGLLHVASISSGMRDRSMVAPLAAIAAGGYGRRELAPGSDLDLLFLLPRKQRIPNCRAGDASLHRRRGRLPLGSWLRAGSCSAVGPGVP